jgi:hypothetical protein
MTRRDWRTAVRAAAVVTLTSGATLQFVQRTDPRFPLVYLTIDSAVLEAAVLSASMASGRDRWPRVRGAATLGVIVSALVYAAVIAPATPTGTWFQPHDDLAVRTATVLLHGVAPVLVLIDFAGHAYPEGPIRREVARWLIWPTAYLAAVVLTAAAGVTVPYDFIRPSVVGLPGAIAGTAGALCLFAAAGVALLGTARRLAPRERFTNGSSA